MSRTTPSRLLAVLMALAIGLVWVLPNQSQAAPLNKDASDKAAAYVVSKLITVSATEKSAGGASGTSDAIVGLVAAGGHAADVAALDTWLKANGKAYSESSSGAAAKIALAAVAAGSNPKAYGAAGDVVARIVVVDPATGAVSPWKDDFNQSLAILGLARSGEAVPAAMVSFLLSLQLNNGAFGWNGGDTDSTGLALQALTALGKSAATDAAIKATAKTAADKAQAWLVANVTDGGYWAGFSPANSTGIVGAALHTVGVDVSAAVTWLAGQQQADGGLPSTLDGTSSNLLATLQGMLLFTGESYVTVAPGASTAPSASASSSASISTSPSASASTSASTSVSPSASVSTSASPSASVSSSASASASVSAPASSVPATTATVSLSSTTVVQGDSVTVTGTGFTSAVRGTVRSEPIDLGIQTPDAKGTVTFTFSTATLALGEHTVTLASEQASVVATFTVTAASSAPSAPATPVLSNTGADVPPIAIAAAALVLIAGVGMVVAGRRRLS